VAPEDLVAATQALVVRSPLVGENTPPSAGVGAEAVALPPPAAGPAAESPSEEAMALPPAEMELDNAAEAVAKILDLDALRRSTQQESDALAAEANQRSKQIGALMQQGQKEQAEALRAQVAEEKDKLKGMADAVTALEAELQAALVLLPNIPSQTVPPGKTPEENITVKEGGQIPALPEGAVPHWDIIKKLNLIDFELGNKITGAGFPVYRGAGALLQRRLIQLFLDRAVAAGYEEIQPPILVNADSGYGTGQLPDKEGQMYPLPQLPTQYRGGKDVQIYLSEHSIQTGLISLHRAGLFKLEIKDAIAPEALSLLFDNYVNVFGNDKKPKIVMTSTEPVPSIVIMENRTIVEVAATISIKNPLN
jgi:seryl-tRNA synthetase